MYFGSVRFYRHLILLVIAAVVIASVGSSLHYQRLNSKLKDILRANNIDINQPLSNTSVDSEHQLSQREKMAQYYMTSFYYHGLYPNLCVENDFIYNQDLPKSVYLTFDDGPSSLTSQLLDILKEQDIKATFFVNYSDSLEGQTLYKRMISEGHTVGVHSTTHQYESIYQTTQTFLDDFAQTAILLQQVTGEKPEIFRFPGGSINSYNRAIYQQTIAEMTRRGYTYYDWNVSSDDSNSKVSADEIVYNVLKGVDQFNMSIVLMHDAGNKQETLDALPVIIQNLKQNGYTFAPLTKDVRPITFTYVD